MSERAEKARRLIASATRPKLADEVTVRLDVVMRVTSMAVPPDQMASAVRDIVAEALPSEGDIRVMAWLPKTVPAVEEGR